MKRVLAFLVLAILCSAAMASAQSVAVTSNSNYTTAALSLNTDLNITATINTALALELKTAAGGCPIGNSGSSPSKSFSMSFGNVDGLGLSAPAGCVTATKSTATGGGYIYTTPYKYVARFSGFNPGSGAPKLQAYYSQTGFNALAVQVLEGDTAGGVSALSTDSGSPTPIGSGLSSDETNAGTTRYIGLQVFEYNGGSAAPASATGAPYTAKITFVLAPQ